ncbi:hypothetical protein WISP_86618 [Willisornis vidua]|uniref:Uncharacterized protein n=1 Tax=Willisornis vidua TaxID=1566151 RepID=A0ABQ9D846_9PASS|nr:hypothetical protein WISP_86618 [Willisornis vidua]
MATETPKFHFDREIHAYVFSETAEHVRQQLPLISPSQSEEIHYKAPGTTESDTGLAGSQRKNSCAEEVTSLAQNLAAWEKVKRLDEKQEIPPEISPWVNTTVGQQHKECFASNMQSGHSGQVLKACTSNTSGYKQGVKKDKGQTENGMQLYSDELQKLLKDKVCQVAELRAVHLTMDIVE